MHGMKPHRSDNRGPQYAEGPLKRPPGYPVLGDSLDTLCGDFDHIGYVNCGDFPVGVVGTDSSRLSSYDALTDEFGVSFKHDRGSFEGHRVVSDSLDKHFGGSVSILHTSATVSIPPR